MRRRTFEQVKLRNEATKCVRDLRSLGVDISMHGVLLYWREIVRGYKMGRWRWLDGCRMMRARRDELPYYPMETR